MNNSAILIRKINSPNLGNLAARVTTGAILFPHGAQKLLGWWSGFGFHATMNYFTETVGLSYTIGVLVILIEFILPIFLILGLFTRLSATAILVLMGGIIATVQNQHFFMNWFGTQQGEGMEFFLLMSGLCLVCILNGGGRFSLDHLLKISAHEN